MNYIKTLDVNGINLEYVQEDEQVYILNNKNRRYILGDLATLDFLKNYREYSEKNMDIEDYLYKKKTNLLDIKILNLKIKSSILNKIVTLLNVLFNDITFMISLCSLIFIPKILIATQKINFLEINIKDIAIIYLAQFFIICLHELGHYQEYTKKCRREYGYFGVGLRYFCLILFYIDVSFLNTLNKNQKIKIILAGIRNQFILNFMFTIMYLSTNSEILLCVICINWIVMITNGLPFMKLDGFWFINTLLNTENYMNDFFMSVKHRKKVRTIVPILGILNITIIVIIFFTTFLGLINKIV